ncbi:MAG: L-asparaginase [Sphingobacteriales bacterium]|jgi:L-asparaginase
MTPKLIIHGGFFSESDTDISVKKAKQDALANFADQGKAYLTSHTALETAIFLCTLLEDCPLFNAGIGSRIQKDGLIRMSASIMDGKTKEFSGIINIQDVQNPILVAEQLLKEEDKVLADQGASDFARNAGFTMFDVKTQERIDEFESNQKGVKTGTVGSVVIDSNGMIAACTSTGGKGYERVGRVSDSCTIAGNYANDDAGVSCTGVGEDIVRAGLAVKVVTRVSDGMTLEESANRTFSEMKEYDGFGGIIAIDKFGNILHQDSHPYMVWALNDGVQTEVFK